MYITSVTIFCKFLVLFRKVTVSSIIFGLIILLKSPFEKAWNTELKNCIFLLRLLAPSWVMEQYRHNCVMFISLQWQIGLGETLCYRFRPSTPGGGSGSSLVKGSTIQVSFLNIRHIYPIANSYHFKLARVQPRCNCDCPGGSNFCNSKTDRWLFVKYENKSCERKFLNSESSTKVEICRVEVGLWMPWKSNKNRTMKNWKVRGDCSNMEDGFFSRNVILCEMALQKQVNYCLKIRKLKLKVTIKN